MGVDSVCRVIRLVCSGAQLVDTIYKIQNLPEDDKTGLNKASRTVQIVSLATEIIAMAAEMGGASNQTLSRIKTVEMYSRGFQIPLEVLNAAFEYDEGRYTFCEALEKGFLSSISSWARAGLERENHHYKHLSLSAANLDKFEEPVYETYWDDKHGKSIYKFIGYQKITNTECLKRLDNSGKMLAAAEVIEITTKLGTTTKLAKKVNTIVRGSAIERMESYQTIINRIRHTKDLGILPTREILPRREGEKLNDNLTDLINGDRIPPELHDDETFQKYICPITFLPIRDPVGDPNKKTLYERSAILEALERKAVSPITGFPLSADQLIEKPFLKVLIDSRLRFHDDQIKKVIQQGLLIPADPAILAPAVTENPNY